jgi:hypothetical protein
MAAGDAASVRHPAGAASPSIDGNHVRVYAPVTMQHQVFGRKYDARDLMTAISPCANPGRGC